MFRASQGLLMTKRLYIFIFPFFFQAVFRHVEQIVKVGIVHPVRLNHVRTEKRLILTGRAGNIILAHIVNESPASAGLFLLAIHREKWHYNKSLDG